MKQSLNSDLPAPEAPADLSRNGIAALILCAVIGPLYFLGICTGYLMFAGVLPEEGLGYVYAVLFLVLFILRAVGIRLGALPTRLSASLYGLYGLIVTIQALWFPSINYAGGKEQYLTLVGDTVVAAGLLLITGEALGELWVSGRRKTLFICTAVPFFACLATITMGIAYGWDATAEMHLLFTNATQSGTTLYNYLNLGDSVALLGLLFLAQLRTLPKRLIVFIITAAGLLFTYSRTSFFVYFPCSILVFFIGAKNSQKIGMAVAVFLLAIVLMTTVSDSNLIRPALDRMTILVTNRGEDQSYIARRELFEQNLLYLSENWIFGRFMDQWWRYGTNSGYIHNWLSFWQSYGILPFLMSVLVFGILARNLWRDLLKPKQTSGAAVALFAYGMIAIITARSYAWPFLWLALSFVASSASGLGSRLAVKSR